MAWRSWSDFTTTGTSKPNFADRALAIFPACVAGGPLAAWKTALPLFSSVLTRSYPRPSSSAWNSAIGTRFALPTFTPRSRAANAVMADGLHGWQCTRASDC